MLLIGTDEGYTQTVGLLKHQAGADLGYTMISRNGIAYLLDTAGQILHTWEHGTNSKHPGYLQDNGDWIAVSRGVKRYDWDGNLIWEYINPEAHHDIAVKPNGNILLLVWGAKTNAEAIAAGRDPNQLMNDLKPMMIYEINPLGQLVWEWHVWDHLIQDFDNTKDNFGVVEDHPELVDINYMRNTGDDWLHGNAIDYNPELEQILVSPRFVNELWIIDQSTTTVEAASHSGGNAGKGGDLLYRWGNPEAYGAVGPQLNFGGHDAQWIKPGLTGEGNIIFFNNGGNDYGRDGNYSSIDEFTPPLNGFNYDWLPQGIYGPLDLVWTYTEIPKEDFYSSFISGAQRLSNGNTLIDEGDKGLVFEVSSEHEIISIYQNPIDNSGILYQGDQVPAAPATSLFRVSRYPKNHPAFIGRNLEPIASIEQYLNHAVLTIQSLQPELIIYPRTGESELGVGQQIPLIFNGNGQYIFSHWILVTGDAVIADDFDAHTTVMMGSADTIIQPNYQINPDWIFGHGFE
ncbi:MAG: aryl-sulfate sulfotransferase [Marinicella sp.]